jgi:hypothetical protein
MMLLPKHVSRTDAEDTAAPAAEPVAEAA